MSKKFTELSAGELRQNAEAALARQPQEKLLSEADARRLLHELHSNSHFKIRLNQGG
jgi:hypothetical protein